MARPQSRQGAGIDIHEMLKRETFDGPPSHGNHFERNRPAPGGVIGASDQYIVLDSFNKLETSRPDQGTFHWDFMVQGVTGDQVIGVRDKVDTVVEMQFGQFFMPPIPKIPYAVPSFSPTKSLVLAPGITLTQNNTNDVVAAMSYGLNPGTIASKVHVHTTPYATSWGFDPLSQTPNGIFTIQVQEAGLQSISDREGARHHLDYALDTTNAGGYAASKGFSNEIYGVNITTPTAATAEVGGWGSTGTTAARAVIQPASILASPQGMPGSAWDTYIFTDPLQDVHGITLQFRGPDNPLIFQPDSYYSIPFITDASSNLCFLVGPELLGVDGTLNVGDRVFVRNFNSGNRPLDSYMNNRNGLTITLSPNANSIPPIPGPGNPTYLNSLGDIILPNFTNTPAYIAPSGTIACYFDPNIYLSGASISTMVPNPVSSAAYYAKFPPRDPRSLAPWSPPPPYQSMVPGMITICGAITVTSGVTVNIAKLRLRIPVRLRRVVQRLTNYMSI